MRCPALHELPPPPLGKTGWPWTEGFDIEHPQTEYPKISIVTPSYNQGKYIEETIRSLLLQGYPNLEYIIIDGGSTDDTVDIIRKYQKWITYWISEPDQGQSDAINKGFAKCTGTIYNWLNSDDFILPGALCVLNNAIITFPDAVAWAGGCYRINRKKEILSRVVPFGLSHEKIANWSFGGFFYQPACFFSAAACKILKGVDESFQYAMDVDLWIRLSAIGKFETVPYMLAAALIHTDAKTQSKRTAMHADIVAAQIKNGYVEFGIQHLQYVLYQSIPKPKKKTAWQQALNNLKKRYSKYFSSLKKTNKEYLTCKPFDLIVVS